MQFIEKYIFTITRFLSIYLCASAIRNIIIDKDDYSWDYYHVTYTNSDYIQNKRIERN